MPMPMMPIPMPQTGAPVPIPPAPISSAHAMPPPLPRSTHVLTPEPPSRPGGITDRFRHDPPGGQPTKLGPAQYRVYDERTRGPAVLQAVPLGNPRVAVLHGPHSLFSRLVHVHHAHLLTGLAEPFVACVEPGQPGQLCLVTPYCEGGTLDGLIQAGRAADGAFRWKCLWELAHAVAFLHGAPLSHQDPANERPILLTELTPETIFMRRDERMGATVCLVGALDTAVNSLGGPRRPTPGFDAPELLVTGNSPAADVYALGCTLYCLFTNTQAAAMRGPPPAVVLESAFASMPPGVRPLLVRMCDANPATRPTMAQLQKALETAVGCDVVSTGLDLVEPIVTVFAGPFAPAAQIVFGLARSIISIIKGSSEAKEAFGVLGSLVVQLQNVIVELMGKPNMEPVPAVEGALNALKDTLNSAKTLMEQYKTASGLSSFLRQHKTDLIQAETDIRRQMEVVQFALTADIRNQLSDMRSDMRRVLDALQTAQPAGPVVIAADASAFLEKYFPTSTRIAFPALFPALRTEYSVRWRPECEPLLRALIDTDGNGFLDLSEFAGFAKPTLEQALTGFFESPEALAVPRLAPSSRPVDATAVEAFRSRFNTMDMGAGCSLIAQARASVAIKCPPPQPTRPSPAAPAGPYDPSGPALPPSCRHVADPRAGTPFTRLPPGTCGDSYLCTDAEHGASVVVKLFRPPVGPQQVGRLVAAQAEFFDRLSHIHHPHLLTAAMRCYRQGPDRVCMVTPFCPAGNLDALIASRPGKQQMWDVLWQQTHALSFLHGSPLVDGAGRGSRNPVVHTDIKPTNILFGADGASRLAGLEMARELVPGSAPGETCMTPGFDAPELPRTGNTLASDVYAMGASLWCLYSGTPSGQMHGPPAEERFVEVLRAYLPGEVRTNVARMCDRDPARRPTMAQLRDILTFVTSRH
ncbi:hypothetical protein PAPYR_9450 [Paratrimastix pyriformis]|uniref:non-specific serine/threonine protein kinase n=1 Tax=Paratrimastix pyriformis TaxID=342808 RepID=A0ABQ8U8A2_9EUKA|nr:hypothetical protein PAPYR_9450 [Paratrimastix pyriformis]